MRFYNYINENKSDAQIIDILEKDCKPYINDWRRIWRENFFYSGRKEKDIFLKKKVRKNRKPRNTPTDIHDFIDNWFKKKFGVKARSNSIFCYMNKGLTDMYGNPYYIIPIGKYKTLTSDIQDLYTEIEDILGNILNDFVSTFEVEDKYNEMDEIQDMKFYDELLDNLNSANYKMNTFINKRNEYMIICDSVYMLHSKYINMEKLMRELI